nr:unnamed protein product [Callosobruchus chinensis]
MIWHQHVSSIATAAGKKLEYLFRARKYFSPSKLLTLYKAQIIPSLEYCSPHIWGAAAPTTLSVQRMAIRLIASEYKVPSDVAVMEIIRIQELRQRDRQTCMPSKLQSDRQIDWNE